MIRLFDRDNWQEIWVTLTRNKLRSILTGFGVFWGIFMLVILVGIGGGFEKGVQKNFAGVASNACFFFGSSTSEAYKGYRKGRQWNMNNRDLELLSQKAKTVEYLSPMLFGASADKNTVRGQKSGSYSVVGVYPANFIIQKQKLLFGRVTNDMDIANNRKTCVIGVEVYETLFDKGENPLGTYIRVNGIYFQIVGVITPESENVNIGSNPKETVFIPFSTMQKAFNQGDVVHFISCTVKPGFPAKMAEDEVKTILKAAHDISPTDEKAIGSFSTEEIFNMFEMLFKGVTFLIWVVGIGALLSGIIGISNIMLVTVRERTREIGVRRAIGAKPSEIMGQILTESFVLTAIFGFVGLVVGVSLLSVGDYLINTGILEEMTGGKVTTDIFESVLIPLNVAISATTILLISGVIAGVMPAFRALSIKPIDAIRDE